MLRCEGRFVSLLQKTNKEMFFLLQSFHLRANISSFAATNSSFISKTVNVSTYKREFALKTSQKLFCLFDKDTNG